MALDYRPLWHVLIDKNMNKSDLIKAAGITSNIMARMSKNLYVNLESIEKICIALECNINDVVTIVPTKQNSTKELDYE